MSGIVFEGPEYTHEFMPEIRVRGASPLIRIDAQKEKELLEKGHSMQVQEIEQFLNSLGIILDYHLGENPFICTMTKKGYDPLETIFFDEEKKKKKKRFCCFPF